MNHRNRRIRSTWTLVVAVLCLTAFPLTTELVAEEEGAAAPLALKGLDPVLLVQGEETEGQADLTATHAGFRYRFANAKTLETFEGEPGRYAIQNDTCPVYPGATLDPSLFHVHEGRIWALATESCVEEFKAEPARFIADLEKHEAEEE